MAISLLPDNPAAWTYRPYEVLYAIPREEREKLQLEAVRINFARMRNRIPALKKLADRQGVEHIDKIVAGNCTVANIGNGVVFGGELTGTNKIGPAGIDTKVCWVDPGREVWLRLTLRPSERF